MIVYDLKCCNDHVFEAWFRDSASCQAQTRAGKVDCPVCGESKVEKAPMAPNIAARAGRGAKRKREGDTAAFCRLHLRGGERQRQRQRQRG